jgi:hypothetical protein
MGEKIVKKQGCCMLSSNTAVSKMLKDLGKERVSFGGWQHGF